MVATLSCPCYLFGEIHAPPALLCLDVGEEICFGLLEHLLGILLLLWPGLLLLLLPQQPLPIFFLQDLLPPHLPVEHLGADVGLRGSGGHRGSCDVSGDSTGLQAECGWDLARTVEVRVFSFFRRVQSPGEISRRVKEPVLVPQPMICPLSCERTLSRGSLDIWGQGTGGW